MTAGRRTAGKAGGGLLRRLLAHPLTRGLDLDDPRTTELRRRILAAKPFLRQLYEEWYRAIVAALPPLPGRVLEIGSGPGFLAQRIDGLITSEILFLRGVALRLDATHLPFAPGSLRAIVMTEVFHHLPRPAAFLAGAARCVRPGGALILVEPWCTPWSSRVYRSLHHEPFAPESESWDLAAEGPLSGANIALPWMVFARDREQLERSFPAWKLVSIETTMPLAYLLSGGVSLRGLLPGWSYPLWRRLERAGGFLERQGMFATIRLERRAIDPGAADSRLQAALPSQSRST